jgi:hypothetical protein
VLEYFAGSRVALHRFTVASEADDDLDVLDRRAPPAVLGSDEFETKALARADCSPEKAPARRRATVRPTLEAIDAAVAAAFGVARCSLYTGRRGHPNLARMAAVHLAAELSGLDHATLAPHYGYERYTGVSGASSRARHRCETDKAFARRIDGLVEQLAGPGWVTTAPG